VSKIGNNGGPLADGWIARHRSVRAHPLVGHGLQVSPADPDRKLCLSKGEAWEDMIMSCNYQDGKVCNGGHWMELRRGELVGAVSYLAHRWNWTPKTVRVFLDALEQDGMISLKKPGVFQGMQEGMQWGMHGGKQKGKQAAVISLCNYDDYQSIPSMEGQAKGQAKGHEKGLAEGQQEEQKKQTKQYIFAVSAETTAPLLNSVSSTTPENDPRSFNRQLVEAAYADYIELAKRVGLTQVREATLKHYREEMIRRMREHADSPYDFNSMIGVWRQALKAIEISAFCQGHNDRGWKADLSYLCQKKGFLKLITGGHGNGAHAKPLQRSLISGTNYDALVSPEDAAMMRNAVPGD